MQNVDGRIIYSASDLHKYLECDYLLALDLEALKGKLKRPEPTEYSKLITGKGIKHEKRHLADLHAHNNGGVVELPEETDDNTIAAFEAAEAATRKAMESGAKVIYQAAFFDGQWFGRADFLIRVEEPSDLGSYSYEAVDTKLALDLKPYFVIQLCFYSDQLARVQGREPEFMHVVFGDGESERLRVSEYSAYCGHLKQSFLKEMARLQALDNPVTSSVPMPVSHCEVCAWDEFCTPRRDEADHLTLVARMRRDQARKLQNGGITTLEQLANATDGQRPDRLREETFATLRHQAALQLEHRRTGRHRHELLQLEDKLGFGLLPEPDEGDIFFDMEGDPLYYGSERNLYYLFGAYVTKEHRYVAFWAKDPSEEKRAFEQFIDFVIERRKQYPKLHVYHYAPYEKTALRTLSVQYATREDEVDNFLREELLVDLYAVVRQTMRISQPKYGIKYVEPLYGFKRTDDIRRGDESILVFEQWRETQDPQLLKDIEHYNDSDCRSTADLLRWLLERRREAIEQFGRLIPWRPQPEPKTLAERREEELAQLSTLQRQLLEPLSQIDTAEQRDSLDDDDRVRWWLGNLLSYHRNEAKPGWWEYFDRTEKTELQL
ncbi:MAG: TM0106 family RecB-like putative nuclease, partial [Candidatus Eremiobacteraeota bacterium]|nr:TM0106 family RecB-like putative nuclease [Candidatus Eremiobacteraeota bacterium]